MEEIKVGDLVEVIEDHDDRYRRNWCESDVPKGEIGVVVNLDPTAFCLWLDFHDEKSPGAYWFDRDSLRKVGG